MEFQGSGLKVKDASIETIVRANLKNILFPLTRPCFSGMGRSVGKLIFLASQIPYPLNLM